MSTHQDLSNSRDGQPANKDYFSRRATRQASWTENLINMDSDEEQDTQQPIEDRDRSPECLSPVPTELLTPGTLSPPVENTETSPLLDTQPSPAYASAYMPIVCCRAGPRPANVAPSTNNVPVFPNGPPQSMSQPLWYRDQAERDIEHNKAQPPHRPRSKRWCFDSRYLHRWVLALGLTAALLLMQRFFTCNNASSPSTENLTRAFDKLDTFSLSENIQTSGLSVRGTISLKPAPEDHTQTSDILVVASYTSSSHWHVLTPRWELTDTSIRLLPPAIAKRRMSFASVFQPRLNVDATIYFRPNATLNAINIDTSHLSITSSPLWTSRKTVLKTHSTAITGSFTLLDLLALSTNSGTISAVISPGEADSSHPVPAQLAASAASGSVDIGLSPGSSYPEREYRTSVSTKSGSIAGTYLLGAAASLKSESGSINAEILPFDSQAQSELHTSARSGRTKVEVLRAHRNGGEVSKSLRSVHESLGSGSLELEYPGEWEGGISARSVSGSVNIKGKGVVVDEASEYVKHVAAHKGEGGSTIEAETVSGSIGLHIGNV